MNTSYGTSADIYTSVSPVFREIAKIKMEETTRTTSLMNVDSDENNKQIKAKPKRIPTENCTILKDPLCNIDKSKNTVVVSNKTPFKALLAKCEKLLDSDVEEIHIRALGAAVNKACSLALQLQENHFDCFDLDIETGTVTLFDNIIPTTDDAGDFESRKRLNSSVAIRVFRKIPLSSLKFKS